MFSRETTHLRWKIVFILERYENKMCSNIIMDYLCQHCGADLDEGDIFEHFFSKYNDYTKALEIATYYGWTPNNKIHFNRSVIIQSEKCSQYRICPDCEQKDPFVLPNK